MCKVILKRGGLEGQGPVAMGDGARRGIGKPQEAVFCSNHPSNPGTQGTQGLFETSANGSNTVRGRFWSPGYIVPMDNQVPDSLLHPDGMNASALALYSHRAHSESTSLSSSTQ